MGEDGVVAARLRSVLAATTDDVRDQTATAAPRRVLYGGPVSARYATGLADLAEVGEPLDWSDVVTSWPDDVDLDPLPDPSEGALPGVTLPEGPLPGGTLPEVALPGMTLSEAGLPETALLAAGALTAGALAAGPLEAARAGVGPPAAPAVDPTSGYPPGTAWASPPGSVPKDLPLSAPGDPMPEPLRPPPNPSLSPAGRESPSLRPVGPPLRAAGPESAPLGFAAPASKPLPPPAWVLPEDPNDQDPWPEPASDYLDEPDPEPTLSAGGAFGGGRPQDGRRFGLGAFDPGSRGVKALAAVAVVVLVLAALLAWRSRPRVDPVPPPSFATTDAKTGPGPGPGPAGPTGGTTAGSVIGSPAGPAGAGAEVVVAVGGKVRKPGLVHLPPGSRVADALNAAGGADPGVDVALLNLARKVVDGELIMVGVTPSPGVALPTGPAATGAAAPGGLINLNTATLADLDTLPGVGPVLAQRILDARDAQGGFKAVSDLRKVDGIGDARYEELKDLVTV